MNNFDLAISSFSGYTGYAGNPPNNETEYLNITWLAIWDFPTWAQVQIAINNVIKNICKQKAKELIASVDWSVLPDVNLQNKAEFETYRATLRDLIFNPVADPTWPVEPTPIPATQGA